MTAASFLQGRPKASFLKIVLIAGLLAGALDIIAACVQYYINTGNKNPERLFQFIASGVFGKDAFTGGVAMAVWGFVFHFLLAILFAALFVWLYSKWELLRNNTVISGLIYGIVVWAIMNKLVLPLSNTPPLPFDVKKALIAMLILMLMIGLPVALVSRYYLKKK